MDKFGIFKLLNSFFSFYEQNKGNFSSDFSQPKTDTPNPLSSILSTLNNKVQTNIQQEQPKQEKITRQTIPLQSSMLSTMNSHDEFIKRVKEKHGTN